MTIYLTPEDLIAINDEFGGPGQGVRDLNGVRSVADKPSAGFEGYEEYPTIWAKAAALLHGIATSQHFTNGNKRTAWLATNLFLNINGEQLRDLPTISQQALTLLAAVGLEDFAIPEVAEWLRENRLKASDRIRYAVLGVPGGSSTNPAAPQPNNSSYFVPVQGITIPKLPAKGLVVALLGVNWYPVDAGKRKTVHAEFRDNAGGALLVDSVATMRTATGDVERHWDAPWFPNGFQPWTEYLALPLLAKAPGQTFVDVYIDGELAWSDSLTWQIREEVPDALPADFGAI
ncbi:type II toxin-antitoxin system death-on-curing family toxin [Paenarthrobacter ureafaciens]|uniref:type II toxin-antitoxin system death-on-curing family toxin n=1 Tax=Paenarthrobacter ureafaciens TaxID=37931 RepID=UPI001FB25E11|nr:Fic family protein [Paenarthrobacter ureafaciens]UOD80367.1 Fic family protein [Paenarthrobacter ureafaciens]WNZ03020.1 Fic family protein [Paenarthrobacter ureafaciens]